MELLFDFSATDDLTCRERNGGVVLRKWTRVDQQMNRSRGTAGSDALRRPDGGCRGRWRGHRRWNRCRCWCRWSSAGFCHAAIRTWLACFVRSHLVTHQIHAAVRIFTDNAVRDVGPSNGRRCDVGADLNLAEGFSQHLDGIGREHLATALTGAHGHVHFVQFFAAISAICHGCSPQSFRETVSPLVFTATLPMAS